MQFKQLCTCVRTWTFWLRKHGVAYSSSTLYFPVANSHRLPVDLHLAWKFLTCKFVLSLYWYCLGNHILEISGYIFSPELTYLPFKPYIEGSRKVMQEDRTTVKARRSQHLQSLQMTLIDYWIDYWSSIEYMYNDRRIYASFLQLLSSEAQYSFFFQMEDNSE